MKRRTGAFLSIGCLMMAVFVFAGCSQRNSREEISVEQEERVTEEMSVPNVLIPYDVGIVVAEEPATEEPAVGETETSETETTEQETQVQSISEHKYVYGTLDKETKKVYDEIYQTIYNQEEYIQVSTLDTEKLDLAYKAVCADYGNLFWSSGYVYKQYTRGDKLVSLEFCPRYTKTASERATLQQQIDAKVDSIISGYTGGDSDYEKAKYVFEYLASNIDYEIESAENQNIISVFIYGTTVCQGYAGATQYLLERFGIPSVIVTGYANGESHAWNLVQMDGEYYYIDTTWGNSRYTDADQQMSRFVNYSYFGITSAELARTHVPYNDFALPDCWAVFDNYYRREGRYFAEWNPDGVGAIYGQGYVTAQSAVSIKFSSPELYQQVKQYFIDEQHIVDYCSGITSLLYVEDVEQNVLTLRFS